MGPTRFLWDPRGRTNRKLYGLVWLVLLFWAVPTAVIWSTFGYFWNEPGAGYPEPHSLDVQLWNGVAVIGLLMVALVVWVIVTLTVRRLHDLGRTGWWTALGLVPVLNLLGWAYLLLARGQLGPNRFGLDPLERR